MGPGIPDSFQVIVCGLTQDPNGFSPLSLLGSIWVATGLEAPSFELSGTHQDICSVTQSSETFIVSNYYIARANQHVLYMFSRQSCSLLSKIQQDHGG